MSRTQPASRCPPSDYVMQAICHASHTEIGFPPRCQGCSYSRSGRPEPSKSQAGRGGFAVRLPLPATRRYQRRTYIRSAVAARAALAAPHWQRLRRRTADQPRMGSGGTARAGTLNRRDRPAARPVGQRGAGPHCLRGAQTARPRPRRRRRTVPALRNLSAQIITAPLPGSSGGISLSRYGRRPWKMGIAESRGEAMDSAAKPSSEVVPMTNLDRANYLWEEYKYRH